MTLVFLIATVALFIAVALIFFITFYALSDEPSKEDPKKEYSISSIREYDRPSVESYGMFRRIY